MTIEDRILQVTTAWDSALVRNEAAPIADFMTDDWVYVGPAGATPKADIIAWIASGRLVHHTMTMVGRPRVVAAGGTVLLTARKRSSGTWEGVPYTADEWISEVFVPSAGSWRCALSHKSEARDA
ncbi:nuclear transport factor 2 family protein [Actinomycetes bacterium KLBMP 9759]